ncbi:hypothetical protein SCLCIDRAFT_1217183 [Scleroderma citrinum Foug A]|uniref:Secreted protein n=1 Tax=Scleroderma citrinum Foug A TaxID=1036808 RepID=A0A0C3DGW8_9AGAM|nr:hypothetical protein SCLCIDRAFT_1217183 [Scleroderma citrinum Foug A]
MTGTRPQSRVMLCSTLVSPLFSSSVPLCGIYSRTSAGQRSERLVAGLSCVPGSSRSPSGFVADGALAPSRGRTHKGSAAHSWDGSPR